MEYKLPDNYNPGTNGELLEKPIQLVPVTEVQEKDWLEESIYQEGQTGGQAEFEYLAMDSEYGKFLRTKLAKAIRKSIGKVGEKYKNELLLYDSKEYRDILYGKIEGAKELLRRLEGVK